MPKRRGNAEGSNAANLRKVFSQKRGSFFWLGFEFCSRPRIALWSHCSFHSFLGSSQFHAFNSGLAKFPRIFRPRCLFPVSLFFLVRHQWHVISWLYSLISNRLYSNDDVIICQRAKKKRLGGCGLVHDKGCWRVLVINLMKLWSKNCGNLLNNWAAVSFSSRTLLRGVGMINVREKDKRQNAKWIMCLKASNKHAERVVK